MAEFRLMNEVIGKKTHGNPVTLPTSTAIICKNWETVRDNIYRIPRGRNTYTVDKTIPGWYNIVQVLDYGDRAILHFDSDTLYRDTGGGVFEQIADIDYDVTFAPPQADFRMQDSQFNSNWYFTTAVGIQKRDAVDGRARYAGVQKALGFDLRLEDDINWLADTYTVAYRVVWSYEDANDNTITGAPSERVEISNNTGGERCVELSIQIPTETTTAYTLEVYRSTSVAGTPPEDLQLVYEANPTAAEVSSGLLTFTDVLPEGFRGADLYTNITQEGIAQQNDRPPKATTMDKYKEYMIYGNVENLQRLYTNLISTTNLTEASSTITVDNGTDDFTVGFYEQNFGTITGAADNGAGLIRITTSAEHGFATNDYATVRDVTGTIEANGGWLVTRIDATNVDLIGSAFVNPYVAGGTINNLPQRGYTTTGSADNGSGKVRYTTSSVHGLTTNDYVLIYDDTGTVGANGVHAVSAVSDTTHFDINVTYVGSGTPTVDYYEDIGATPRAIIYMQGTDAQNIDNTARSLVKTINLTSANEIVDAFYVSGAADPTGKIELVGKILGEDAFYLVADSDDTGGCFSPLMPTTGTDYVSTNTDWQHAIMYSKQNQPESVPISNITPVGNKGDPILKVVGLRDSLFIIKQEDGIYRLTGDSPSNWTITEFDGTLECLQRNSIAKGQNSIFMFSSVGYVQISDAGVEIIGRDNEFKDLIPSKTGTFEQDGYGWFYETEKSYFCSTYTDTSSTDNDIVHVFNTYTRSWSDREYGIYTSDTNIRAARVIDDVAYTAPLTGVVLLQERKAFATTDFSTPDIDVDITDIDTDTNTVTLADPIVIPLESKIQRAGYTKTIIEITSTTEFVLSNVNNLTTGGATIFPGIVSTLRYQGIHCGIPEYGKQFRTFHVFFDNDETSIKNISAKTFTDLDKTAQEVLFNSLDLEYWGKRWGVVWGGKRVTDKWLLWQDQTHHRGDFIYLELTHRVPQEQCAICGASVIYEALTQRPTS